MQFCKDVLVAHDFSEVARAYLAGATAGHPVRINGAPGQKRGHGSVISAAGAARGLFFAPFLFFLMLFGARDNAACDARKCPPDGRRCSKSAPCVPTSESDQRVIPSLATGHRIGKAKHVGDGITSYRITEAQWARRQTSG